MVFKPTGRRVAMAIGSVCLLVSTAVCCNIPVFRYALENWQPSAYQVLILSRGPLTTEQRGTVDLLETAAVNAERPANLQVHAIDVAGGSMVEVLRDRLRPHTPPDWALEQLAGWCEKQTLEAPELVVFYPGVWDRMAWQASLSEANVEKLIDSPVRQEIANRLLNGQSAVWVLLESGDAERDDEAWKTLQDQLFRSQSIVQLPARDLIETDEFFRPEVDIELRVEFSAVRIAANDEQETAFVSMLRGSDADPGEFDAPIAIPIYGRGRTYFALIGPGINGPMIEESGHFLCGACSCQVKEDNPGLDMLMAVNWSDRIQGSAMPEVILPELTGIGGLELATQTVQKAPVADPTLQVAAAIEGTEDKVPEEIPSNEQATDSNEGNAVDATAPATHRSSDEFQRNLLFGVAGGTVVAVLVLTLATFILRRG